MTALARALGGALTALLAGIAWTVALWMLA